MVPLPLSLTPPGLPLLLCPPHMQVPTEASRVMEHAQCNERGGWAAGSKVPEELGQALQPGGHVSLIQLHLTCMEQQEGRARHV